MTRRSRTSAATTAKRAAPATIETTPTRQSKRVKTTAGASNGVSASPRKSKYFEGSEEPESSVGGEASGYEDDDASAVLTSDESEEGFDAEDSHEEAVGRSKRSAKKGGVVQVALARGKGKGSELWRPGVKTGLGPGQQVIVKKPKAREAGDVAYQEDTIHPNTMLFLGDLKRNNDRDWLKLHDPDYKTAKKDWEDFVDVLTERIAEVDETIPELPHKDLVSANEWLVLESFLPPFTTVSWAKHGRKTFRIYRDIRFSKDPTPYKTHFSAAWSRTGRKGPYAAYYVQIQPGGSFVGGGLWLPEPVPLGLLRRDIDRHPQRIRTVLNDADIRKEFLDNAPNNEEKAVKAFIKKNVESALKTKPKVSG
ncbi:MAG: hypothetical protein M1824_000292 [Vezdaea acicularis]|nr:MAG: hypothetical protein M1824_000292 [Vezdaea acicularis]